MLQLMFCDATTSSSIEVFFAMVDIFLAYDLRICFAKFSFRLILSTLEIMGHKTKRCMRRAVDFEGTV